MGIEKNEGINLLLSYAHCMYRSLKVCLGWDRERVGGERSFVEQAFMLLALSILSFTQQIFMEYLGCHRHSCKVLVI